MKISTIILLLCSCALMAQPKFDKTKISQSTQPDCSISSITVTTKVFAQHTGTDTWEKIYETEIAVRKNRYAKKVRQQEYRKAVEMAGTLMNKLNAEAAQSASEAPATFEAR